MSKTYDGRCDLYVRIEAGIFSMEKKLRLALRLLNIQHDQIVTGTNLGKPSMEYSVYIHGLVQDFSTSIADALDLLHFCTKPSMYFAIAITYHDLLLFFTFNS